MLDSWLLSFDSWFFTLDVWLLTLDSWLLSLDSWLLTLDSWLWLLTPKSWFLTFYCRHKTLNCLVKNSWLFTFDSWLLNLEFCHKTHHFWVLPVDSLLFTYTYINYILGKHMLFIWKGKGLKLSVLLCYISWVALWFHTKIDLMGLPCFNCTNCKSSFIS